ncbi:MAG: GNAT family N-acetyltransferase [Deltaproteobacteria bacterium]|nr:GNAT family N-acetyltransferase [Kofleriaceae bacterium]
MTVRALAAADRAAIAEVIASDETFKADEVAVALELVDAAIAGSTDYEVRVAIDGDAGVCGYICFGRTPMTARTYDLYWIVVHARGRGRGVARRLVDAMEAEIRARGGGQIRVETSETDGYGSARAVYARLGYPEASRLPDFYAPGDALITYYKVL